MVEEMLQEIGLTKGEIAVYKALLALGSSTAGPIIKKAKISPSKIYDILQRLMQKGLVSYIVKSNRKHFEAAPARRILDYITAKEEKIKEQRKLAEKVIPSLEHQQQEAMQQNNATVYMGIKGIKTAFIKARQETRKGSTYIGLFIPQVDERLVPFFDSFTKEFCKNVGKTKMLFNEPSTEKDKIQKINGCKCKILSEQFRVPMEICVIGDHVLISTTASKNPMMVLIKNNEMANSFRKHFELLWKVS